DPRFQRIGIHLAENIGQSGHRGEHLGHALLTLALDILHLPRLEADRSDGDCDGRDGRHQKGHYEGLGAALVRQREKASPPVQGVQVGHCLRLLRLPLTRTTMRSISGAKTLPRRAANTTAPVEPMPCPASPRMTISIPTRS